MAGRRVIVMLSVLAVFGALSSVAQADRPFTLRFSADDTGDITILANTLMTCPLSHSSCATARQGTGSNLNNNNYGSGNPMQRVDVDGDPTTFTSSGAMLALPPGATVLFAGLYYGARFTAGAGGTTAPNNTVAGRSTVKLRPPGAPAYLTLGPAGTVLDTGATNDFAGFIDVTGLVAAAGAGEYFVADVQSATGEDRYAGWALVVAFRDTARPPRNMSVFDGLQSVSRTNPVSIPIVGFRTPPAGPVRSTIGGAAYEGDRGTTGDVASLDDITGQDATRPANNFFNSSIAHNGTHFTAKNPNYVNQLGFDAALLNATGALQNGATSAVIRLSSTGDVYLPHVITFSTELFAPAVAGTKTVTNLTNPGGATRRGDTLRYTVTFTNTGQDGATDFRTSDLIPAGTTYVPASLQLVSGPGTLGPKTDAAGDDVAEFDAANNSVVFRLGTGANATQGGLIGAVGTPGPSSSFSFDVTVDADNPDGAELLNQARAEFFAQSLGVPLSADAQVSTTVAAPDLTIAKSHTGPITGGTTVPFRIEVENVGALATDGSTVTVSDTFPAAVFASLAVTNAPGWSCGVIATTLTCTRSDALPAGDGYPPIELNALVVPSPPAEVENTATVAGGGDSNPTNNASTDVGPGVSEADLQVTKMAQPETVLNGDTVTFTVVVRNGGPSAATGVVVDDPLAPNFSALNATSTQGTCDTSVQCTIGTLAAGAEATITIAATVTGTGPAHDNTATATSATSDPTGGNNSATVTINVPNTADLRLTKTAAPANPLAGAPDGLTYTLTIVNDGPATATNVVVTDQLPDAFTPSSAGGSGFACNLPGAGGTLTCTRPVLTVAEGPVTITIVGTIAANSAGTVVKNSATVRADQGDPGVRNNDGASTDSLVAPAADLDVAKFADKSRVKAGGLIRYTIRVTNRGPTDATNVRLTDSVTGRRKLVSISTSQGSCTLRPPRCTLGTLTAGSTATVTLRLRALRPGTITNRAVATSDLVDPVTSSNRSLASRTTVTRGPGRVVITKKADRKSARAGQRVRFTITVRARGNATALRLKVCDRLPSALFLSSARGAPVRGQKACWRVRALNPGKKRKFRVIAVANSSTTRRVTNVASVKGANVRLRKARASVQVLASPGGGGDCVARTSLFFC